MKRLMILSLMFLGIFFVAPVWSHHMAEGIVSDEVWLRVDEQLESSNSLHNINMESVLDSMTMELDPNGNEVLSSEYTVLTEDVDEYMEALTSLWIKSRMKCNAFLQATEIAKTRLHSRPSCWSFR